MHSPQCKICFFFTLTGDLNLMCCFSKFSLTKSHKYSKVLNVTFFSKKIECSTCQQTTESVLWTQPKPSSSLSSLIILLINLTEKHQHSQALVSSLYQHSKLRPFWSPLASAKNFCPLKFQRKSPIGDRQIIKEA